jgi:hypothetical protein
VANYTAVRPFLYTSTIPAAIVMALAVAMVSPHDSSAADVLTFQYDNSRDGANTNEMELTPLNVNTNNFGRLFTYTVDGYIYAQPLYVSNVTIPGQGTRNVVFVATENDSVYAFDADSNKGPDGGLLWQTNLGIAAESILFGIRYHHNVLNPLIGITGTPVIDPALGTLYVDVFSGEVLDTTNCVHRLHALNIATGAEQPFSPVLVTASVPGTGVDSINGVVNFTPQNHMNRPALTLADGVVYVAYGSYGDTDPYHGWVIGFSATNLQQLTNYAFATTPNATTNAFGINAGEGALWMGGGGLCVDDGNNLYFETGNGSFSAHTNGGDYGDCFVKLSTSNQLTVMDYFAPSNQASMALNDEDLGSGGPILLPDSASSAERPHLMVGAGKEGTLYLVDRDNLGHFSASSNNIVQTVPGAIRGVWGSPAYFNNLIYFQGVGDVMKAFRITNGVITTSPVTRSTTSFGGVGYTPSISANGTSNAIAWVIDTSSYGSKGPAVLHAYNATNLSQELYNSSQNLVRDNPGGAVKYAVPVVADGKVFVRGEDALSVYGLLPGPALGASLYANSVVLSWPTNSTLLYSLEGSTNIVAGNWFSITNQATVTNGVFQVSFPLTGAVTFYRLKR